MNWKEAERGAKTCPDFIEEETEAQRGGRSSPPSWVGTELGATLWLPVPRQCMVLCKVELE